MIPSILHGETTTVTRTEDEAKAFGREGAKPSTPVIEYMVTAETEKPAAFYADAGLVDLSYQVELDPDSPMAGSGSGKHQHSLSEETGERSTTAREEAVAGIHAMSETPANEQVSISVPGAISHQDVPHPSPARQILSHLASPVRAAMEDALQREDTPALRQLKIALRPDELGSVSVTLRLRDSALSILIETSVPEAADILRRDRGLLDDMLKPLTGEGKGAEVTIVSRQAEPTEIYFEDVDRGGTPKDFAESGAGQPSAERERSPSGKQERASEAGERTPAHEAISPVQRHLPGTLVL
jgi:hypothetical protein